MTIQLYIKLYNIYKYYLIFFKLIDMIIKNIYKIISNYFMKTLNNIEIYNYHLLNILL